uniref:Coagulation factor V n=1 Tax=Echeneis naucrates TaxID=173247 RepID=A0A665V2I4_ECHNA
MRLCVWAGARGLLPFLLLLSALHVHATQPQPKERHYYIAAVEIDWKYSAVTQKDSDESLWIAFACSGASSCFPSAGLLGPTLRAEQGETIVVTFRNMAYGAYSIHPHGIAYGKQSEGAYYFDNTSQKEKEDDIVLQNREHVYYWEVTPEVSPQSDDPTCLTYTYISHQNVVGDYNSGLIGALLICKPGSLDESGQQRRVHHEYVFLFGVFDENKSRYKPNSPASDDHVKYTINGYTKGSLPGQSTYVPSIPLLRRSSGTTSPLCTNMLMRKQHLLMHFKAFCTLLSCLMLLTVTLLFNPPMNSFHFHTSLKSILCLGRVLSTWQTKIKPLIFLCRDFNFQYLKQSPTRIGQKYKKVVYTLYNNESFTERGVGVWFLCPLTRPPVPSQVVFKNMASRPYSIYPHGLIMSKSNEGVNYPEGVSEETEPLDGDSRCLTRMYHSAVNTPRDIASGLIGPILICKRINALLQFKADKEQHAMFAAFDENKSWYLEDNIRLYTDQTKVNRADVDFYRSNIMHTINGYVFEGGPILGFCNGEVVTWHVSSIGAQDYIQTATFYGHPFKLNERTEDFLSLYPMTGETIMMDMDNIAVPKKQTMKVTRRHKPQSGKGMKTKRRKEYKPLARSGLPFSPRGFNPGMTPRGARPMVPQVFSNEDELINMPVVIGVPRPDFSDYELYIPGEDRDYQTVEEQKLDENDYEYVTYKDPYSDYDTKNLNLDDAAKYYLKSTDPNIKTYFIAAEEFQWDYGDKVLQESRETIFTKVIFRRYLDSTFNIPDIRGELDEHLGILGPLIKAEVGQSIVVVFKNNGNRPYSIHPNGVSYTKLTEGLSYDDESKYWFKYDNEVQPNSTFTYMWKVNSNVGPSEHESACRTWTYYSGVNPEKDIHSGLIGPLLVCRKGTLTKSPTDVREFMLLFMTFDESQSWYYERNREIIQRKTRRKLLGTNDHIILIKMSSCGFPAINGIIFNLKGLRMYTNQLARWHLINMGSPKDVQSIHFHGQTFLNKKTSSYRQAVYPLLPGDFATLEMYPSRPGLWQLETEVGMNQQEGMQTLFLVLDNDCDRPLGLESGSVKNSQITASNTRGSWMPHLARLNNQGQYNAWSTDTSNSFIQVDFQRPVVIGHVATQGAKQMFQSQYVVSYTISYSTDRRRWTYYKGDSVDLRKVGLFAGNQEAYGTKTNVFFPPVVGRYIRLHPLQWYNRPTLRMEFYGCELDGCSLPLGMESGAIEDHRITASSTASSWYSGPWTPSLARLNRRGNINAWQAKNNNMNQWLQVELPQVKKITGIITQGAKSLGKEMFVDSYSLQYSNDGIQLFSLQTFSGNTNNNDHVKNYIYPPIFSRFIRIIPRNWTSSITMRIELLGCDFE